MISSKYFSDRKSFLIWTYLMALIPLCGCDQAGKITVSKKKGKKLKSDTLISSPVTTPAVTGTIPLNDCPRGASEPVVKTTVFPNAQFTLQPDHMTGLETFTLPKGDRVKITQSGCEYYLLKFQIETSRFAADSSDMNHWKNAAMILMREISQGISTPLEISKGLDKLSAQIRTDQLNSRDHYQLGEEIDFGGSDPREYLTIDRVSHLAEQRYLIEMTFSYGPI